MHTRRFNQFHSYDDGVDDTDDGLLGNSLLEDQGLDDWYDEDGDHLPDIGISTL